MASSLFEPNVPLVSRFNNLLSVMRPVSKEPVQTYRLDEVVNKDEIDFLKLDVQGAELSVLKGAKRLAPSALVIHTEVEFIPMYVNQPLFADVDSYLRMIGFQFHTFLGFGTRDYIPGLPTNFAKKHAEQFLWSDAVYVPNVLNLEAYSDTRLLKLAALLHDIYASIDLVLYVLKVLETRGNTEPLKAYQAKLAS